MRIKDQCFNASCATMSNKKVVNGDPTDHNGVKNEFKSESPKDLDANAVPVSPSSGILVEGGASRGPKKRIRDAVSDHSSSVSPDLENPSAQSSVGGRLKFFKDGKFILELSHKKEGDKTCWIPVTKKPCWPPISTPRPGSLTSLSASDDNSSVLSFPWQREHRWKQISPRQYLNQDIGFFLWKPKSGLQYKYKSCYLRRKPFDSVENILLTNNLPRRSKKDDLATIIQGLWERIIANKSEPDIVSPRKRILKEFEKVSLDEASKRQKGCLPGRVVSAYSIAAILDENDDTVLRTLLRSPSTSPDSVVSRSPGLPSGCPPRDFPNQSNPVPPIPFPASALHFPPPYRVPHQHWPIPFPLSAPQVPLPMYPMPPYFTSAHIHPPRALLPEPFPDTPLNLSKNSG